MIFNRYPIIVFSTPRVGSTAVSQYIRSKCQPNLPYFFEPDYLDKTLLEFQEYFTNHKTFILKLHYYALQKYPKDIVEYICTSPDAFRIRLRRRNFVNQIASLYTAHTRNLPLPRENKKWHFVKGIDNVETTTNETIEIKDQRIKDIISFLNKVNSEINDSQINFDLDLYYEDICNEITNTTVFVAPKPKNYAELIETINHHLNSFDIQS